RAGRRRRAGRVLCWSQVRDLARAGPYLGPFDARGEPASPAGQRGSRSDEPGDGTRDPGWLAVPRVRERPSPQPPRAVERAAAVVGAGHHAGGHLLAGVRRGDPGTGRVDGDRGAAARDDAALPGLRLSAGRGRGRLATGGPGPDPRGVPPGPRAPRSVRPAATGRAPHTLPRRTS